MLKTINLLSGLNDGLRSTFPWNLNFDNMTVILIFIFHATKNPEYYIYTEIKLQLKLTDV